MWKRSRIAVVGTGAVGREVLTALADADVPSEWITVLGSERGQGEELPYGDDDSLEVERLEDDSFRGQDVVILAVPIEHVRRLAHQAQAAGAWVIDVSPTFRLEANVPLALPALTGGKVTPPSTGRVIATPSPVTTALALGLAPLHERFGLSRVSVTALLGASSAGLGGVRELEKTTADLLSGKETEPVAFPHRLAFNLVPQVGPVEPGSGYTAEELSWSDELERLTPDWRERPVIAGTAIQVPTFFGHMLSVEVELKQDADIEAVRAAWKGSAQVKVLDDASERIYPMPMLVGSDPTVHVGRIRRVPAGARRFLLVLTLDNAGRGAALTAVETAAALIGRA